MVAVAVPQGLTADLFLQMTATLAHLSQLKNATGGNLTDWATDPEGLLNDTFINIKRDMASIPTSPVVDLIHSHVRLSCLSTALTVRKLEWRCRGCFSISATKETRVAVLENESPLTLIYPERFSITQDAGRFSLSVNPALTDDSGVYFCLVNGQSQPTSALSLQIQDVPSTPGKPLIMKFDSSSVELSWSPPLHQHHSPIVHYRIHILEGEGADWSTHRVLTTKTADTTFTVTDLHPFTVYSFKVTAVNKIGPSNQSQASYHMMTLREVPSGKPTITAAHNLSASSIKISWRPPNISSINGEFLGYQVSWKARSSHKSGDIKHEQVKDPEETMHVITGLETYTQYLVSLQVINPEGLGPASTVVVMTDEGVPSGPMNITELQVANDSITLHWVQPENPNGVIIGYRLYYMTKKMTDVVTVKDNSQEIIYRLQNLAPYTKYSIWAKAFTSKHEGDSSATLETLTDVSGPGRPVVTNLTCPGASSLYVEWTQPDNYFHSVDSYVLHYKARSQDFWDTRTVVVPPVDRPSIEKMLLTNLTTNTEYELFVQALTSSLYREDVKYPGSLSETHTLTVNRNCDSILVSPMREEELKDNAMVSLAIVVGATGVFLVLLVAVMSLAFWRRRKMKNHFYIPSSQSQRDDVPLWDLESLDTENGKTPVPANMFLQHVQLLHADGGHGFHKEYDYIANSIQGKKVPGKTDTDTNNLTFVDGFQNKNAYVLTNIYSDCDLNKFWQFILEQSIQIVIFTECRPLLELGGEVQCLGALSVIPCPPSEHPGFTVQGFKISRRRISKKEEQHYVSVYHYSPSKPRVKEKMDFLRFVKHSFNSNKAGGQILLSRTSAAITYMTVCTMLQQSQLRGELNILTYVCHILSSSPDLQLQLAQYIFLHDVLAEAITAGNTSVVKHNLPCYVRSLESSEVEGCTSWKTLEKQFSLSTEIHPPSHQYLTAVNPVNHQHNNSMDYVAVDLTRVVLQPMIGGTDYINCSWIPGYSRADQFILSQHPSPATIAQFWHMVWQSDATLIVCLSVFQQPFWPSFKQPLHLGNLKVTTQTETSVSGYQAVNLCLEVDNETSLGVQLIFCPNWPHLSVPVSNCVHLVDCLTRLATPDKPTVVIDSFGATEAAIFIVLSSLVRQMDLEDNVDVFHWFKCVHLCRPGIWVSPDNLLFLYRVMAELCSIKRATIPTTGTRTLTSSGELNI